VSNGVPLDRWRTLYAAADRLKAMAPWQWMSEADIFGVERPGDESLMFVSVMGELGQHQAVSAYLGAAALHGFLAMEASADDPDPDTILELPQLQASFGDASVLQPEDRVTVKALGLTYRGKTAWPLFRSYRPGYFPWFLDEREVAALTVALEQTLDVAPRQRADASLLKRREAEQFLIRRRRAEQGADSWEDRIERVPAPEPAAVPMAVDAGLLDAVRRLPRSAGALELDVFLAHVRVGEPGDRPVYPYALMITDPRSGMIVGTELLAIESSFDTLWASVPGKVAGQLASAGKLPAELRVTSERLLGVLQPMAREVGIRVRRARSLPALETAKAALLRHFGGG
jgi:hypothetical protein